MYVSCFRLPAQLARANGVTNNPGISILKKIYSINKKEERVTLIIESEENPMMDSPPYSIAIFILPLEENEANNFIPGNTLGILHKEYATTLDGNVILIIEYE